MLFTLTGNVLACNGDTFTLPTPELATELLAAIVDSDKLSDDEYDRFELPQLGQVTELVW